MVEHAKTLSGRHHRQDPTETTKTKDITAVCRAVELFNSPAGETAVMPKSMAWLSLSDCQG